MFFKTRASPEHKGETIGNVVSLCATLAARDLVKGMAQLQNEPYLEGNLDLLLEVHAFYMHLANRLAFRDLGQEACNRFSPRMMVAVANSITTTLSHELRAAHVVAELRDKYNEREDYYAQFQRFLPEQDKSPKNTLFWEFSKVIFYRFIQTEQTADLILVDGILTGGIAAFLKKANEILRG